MSGREICKSLKEIRRKLAQENDIEYLVSECSFQGECKGICPKCEEELRYLEEELEKRKRLGQVIAITGISAGVLASAVASHDVLEKGVKGIDEKVRDAWNQWAQSKQEINIMGEIGSDWE